VLVARPKNGILRKDGTTNKPLNPRFIVLGINGDDKALWTTIAQSQGGKIWRKSIKNDMPSPADGQQMVTIRYSGKKTGLIGRRVPLGEREDITVTEFDLDEARGELAVLDELGITAVDVLDESRGDIINTIAMELTRQQGKLVMFKDVLGISPAGQGKESFVRSHGGAALIAVQGLFRTILAGERADPMARQLKSASNMPGGRFRRDILGWRREQVSVAKSAESKLHLVAAELAKEMNDPANAQEQSLTHAFNHLDPAIREKRAARAQNELATRYGSRVEQVPHKRTDFRGHPIPYGTSKPIRWIDRHFEEIRRDRRQTGA
jgi:hypothetical protein